MHEFSQRFRFSDWPNPAVPLVAAGNYAIWSGEQLIYCGMSGRQFDPARANGKRPLGLYTRLASHASGRLSGDQFCVYVANRLVLPELRADLLPRFASGEMTLDALTKQYIHARFEYQFVCVENSRQAFALEGECRRGLTFGAKPVLNPA
jgi:hypothetical protein